MAQGDRIRVSENPSWRADFLARYSAGERGAIGFSQERVIVNGWEQDVIRVRVPVALQPGEEIGWQNTDAAGNLVVRRMLNGAVQQAIAIPIRWPPGRYQLTPEWDAQASELVLTLRENLWRDEP